MVSLRGARAIAGTVVAFALAIGASGCSASTPEPPASTTSAPPASTTPAVVTSHSPVATPSASPATEDTHVVQIAYSMTPAIKVSDTAGGNPTRTVNASDVLTAPADTPLVFLVKQVTPQGVEVYLPIRPNGATGWVSPKDVTLYATDYAIDVYLAQHHMVVSQAGIQLADYPIATGRDGLPTPGGVYFLRELLQPPDPNGIYGPYAYGLSGYSPVLDSFAGGDAVVGIHGTNEPDTIGSDVSHGCIRVSNKDVTQMVKVWKLPLGTPVYIHP